MEWVKVSEAATRLGITARGLHNYMKVHNVKTKTKKQSIIKRQKVKLVDIDALIEMRKKRIRAGANK